MLSSCTIRVGGTMSIMLKVGEATFVVGVAGTIFLFFLGPDPVRMQAAERCMLIGIGLMVTHLCERRS